MKTEVLLVTAGALCATTAAVPGCIALARRLGIVDHPGPLKTQQAAVPYLGGLAVFVGLLVGTWVGRPIVLAPLAAVLAVGVADDRFGLPPKIRLGGEIVIGATIASVQPTHLPDALGWPLVIATSVILINGFNLLDGLDMLAAGVAAAAAVGFAVVTDGSSRLLAVSLAGALGGFLLFNRPPARIYLGDGGSYLLGASMAVLLTYAWGPGVDTAHGMIALALVILPTAEVICAVVRRRRSGRSLLSGDRAHPYDLLVARGWTPAAASAVYIGAESAVVVVTVAAVLGHVSVTMALAIDAAVLLVILLGGGLVGGLSASTGSSR